jgi:CBS domain-containing protein
MDSEPLGVITRHDVLREVVKNRNLENLQAREVMSTSFSAIREDSDVLGLCSLMAEKGFEAMPVLLNDQVVGVVHTRDVFPPVFDFLVRVQNAARDGMIKDSDVKG